MLGTNVTVWLAFLEGLASFLSPCILPLIPVYIGYLAGSTVEDIEHNETIRRTMLRNTVGFVLGISFVYISLGAGASVIGRFLFDYNDLFRIIGAIFIIVFGLFHTGLIKLNFLNRERRVDFKMKSPKFTKAFLLGMTFSFGWTPCIGPMLGSILFMAGNTGHVLKGIGLLAVYSLGMTIPLLLTAFLMGKFIKHYKKFYKYFDKIKMFSGILLIIMGIFMLFDLLSIFAKL